MVLRRNVGPIVPWRDADLLGEVVNAVNGSAFVTAANNQCIGDSRKRLRHNLQKKGFPFAGDFRSVDFLFANQLVNNCAFADGANEDQIGPGFWLAYEQ